MKHLIYLEQLGGQLLSCYLATYGGITVLDLSGILRFYGMDYLPVRISAWLQRGHSRSSGSR